MTPNGTRLLPTGRLVPDGLDESLIAAVVDAFYARARHDPLLGPIFLRVIPDAEWAEHMRLIADFWSAMLLGTRRYDGRPMPKHIAIGELEDAHFARWLALFRQTVEELCPPLVAAMFVERAERIAQSMRLGLAFHRGQDTVAIRPIRAGPVSQS